MLHSSESFDVPVVLFMFKRYEKILLIMEVLRKVKPIRLYLLSDGPRNLEENKEVELCRNKVLAEIDWQCEVIKKFSTSNIGVFENIGLGAKWVFEREKTAIFLEDDNLPSLSFFRFCKENLDYYKENDKVFWVCGTNYLVDSSGSTKNSYFFTQNMQPCGWASWSKKFNKYYDGYLEHFNSDCFELIADRYTDQSLMRQDIRNWEMEKYRLMQNKKPNSWDYQMSFTLRYYDLLGIVPVYNQIKNIGVDEYSIHGGVDLSNIMLQRFCYLENKELKFPIKHPSCIELNSHLEKKLGNIIKFPISYRIKGRINRFLKLVLRIHPYTPILKGIKNKWKI